MAVRPCPRAEAIFWALARLWPRQADVSTACVAVPERRGQRDAQIGGLWLVAPLLGVAVRTFWTFPRLRPLVVFLPALIIKSVRANQQSFVDARPALPLLQVRLLVLSCLSRVLPARHLAPALS